MMCWEPLEAPLVVRSPLWELLTNNNKIEDKNDLIIYKEQFYSAKLLVSILSFSRGSQVSFDGGVSGPTRPPNTVS